MGWIADRTATEGLVGGTAQKRQQTWESDNTVRRGVMGIWTLTIFIFFYFLLFFLILLFFFFTLFSWKDNEEGT